MPSVTSVPLWWGFGRITNNTRMFLGDFPILMPAVKIAFRISICWATDNLNLMFNMKFTPLLIAAMALGASSASAVLYSGNGGTSFGGVVSSIDITNNATNITFTLNRGPGLLSDALVIYIDSVTGGSSSTTNFTDNGDPLRASLSGRGVSSGVSVVTFPTGFTVDYGIALNGGFSGVWGLVNSGSHNFLATANGAPGGNAQTSYVMTTTLASLGLTVGNTLRFVATYLNSDNDFRSNEGVGDGLPPGTTNVGVNPASFTASRSYTVVPEPTSVAFLSLLGLTALRRRR